MLVTIIILLTINIRHGFENYLSSTESEGRTYVSASTYQLSAVGSNYSLHLLNKLGRSPPFPTPPPTGKKKGKKGEYKAQVERIASKLIKGISTDPANSQKMIF